MPTIIDELLVGLVLLASVIYAAFALGPKTLRGRVLRAAAGVLRRLPAVPGVHVIAQRLQAAAGGKAGGACGGCDNCGSEPRAEAPPAAEVRVPLAKIGRR